MLLKGDKFTQTMAASRDYCKHAFGIASSDDPDHLMIFVEHNDGNVYLVDQDVVIMQITTDPLKSFMIAMADTMQQLARAQEKAQEALRSMRSSATDAAMTLTLIATILTDHKSAGATQTPEEAFDGIMLALAGYGQREENRIRTRAAAGDDGECGCPSCEAQRAEEGSEDPASPGVHFDQQLSEMLNGVGNDPDKWAQIRDLAVRHGGVLGGDDLGEGSSLIGFTDTDKGHKFMEDLKKALSH